MFVIPNVTKVEKQEKEVIHSGHFMVSHFEAEEQDDEDEIAVPLPDVPTKETYEKPVKPLYTERMDNQIKIFYPQQIPIETSLTKLFQCMSLAYRQKLTSPKWNRFRGIRLRWKDKIRLNNVIWRCWHMQFIKKENTLICQFASPLDVDTHNKPEAVVLEGKYWKRKLAAVTAEYKKWRMFYRNQSVDHSKDFNDIFNEVELLKWDFQNDNVDMLVDEDYMGLMSDTLFSTITNQPFAFPDSREIAKAGLADFIQPSLGPLQPNLPNNDFMDTMEHFDMLSGKLATVPEEQMNDGIYNNNKQIGWCYNDLGVMNSNSNIQINPMSNSANVMDQYQSIQPLTIENVTIQDTRQPIINFPNGILISPTSVDPYVRHPQSATYPPSVISKSSKHVKVLSSSQIKVNQTQDAIYNNKPVDVYYGSISTRDDPLQLREQHEYKLLQTSDPTQSSREYRITPPITSNVKYSSQMNDNYKLPPRPHLPVQAMPVNSLGKQQPKEEKVNNRMRTSTRGRRSRSNTREPIKRPTLQTAISDPSLITPANNIILTQLLTSNSENTYPRQSQSTSSSLDTTIRCKEENPSQLCILPHSSTNPGAVLITPVNMSTVQNTSDPLLLNSLSSSSSHVDSNSQPSLNSPTSPQGPLGSPNREPVQREQRRAGHIHAEQKRRYNIKNGFDIIHSLIPHLNQNPNAKLSKAAMLQKGAEYIIQLKQERDQLNEEMDSLRQRIDSLNTSISNCQSLLPATGAPVSRRTDSKLQEMFEEHVRIRTADNWKYWIFSIIFKSLLQSFNNFVSTSSLEDLYRSTLHWIEQHCTLVDLRPVVLNSLRYLSTKTDILSNPAQLPEEARKQVNSVSKKN